MEVLAATGNRLVRLERAGGAWSTKGVLDGEGVRCVAAGPGGRVLAGTSEGVRVSDDGGGSFERVELPERDVFSVAVSAADGALYAGTEPSRLFRSAGPGEGWEELTALQEIPSRSRWSFPPRPWTHHVRWIAPSPHDPDRLLVGIELGGVMLSTDRGRSFSDHRPGAQADCHTLAWHPSAQGRVYEAAGGGAAWSRDGGESWDPADRGRDLRYCWAIAPSPEDPDRWWLTAAPGPREAHGGGRAGAKLYRWQGEGPWEQLAGPMDSMPYGLLAADGRLFMGMKEGGVLTSADGGRSWERIESETESVLALAASG